MSTYTVDFNREVFAKSELDQVDLAIKLGHTEHLAAILNDVTPEKAQEIERIQSQLRPKDFVFRSQAQQDFEIWSSQHQAELTPAIEKEWQEKIEAEKQERLKMLGADTVKSEVKNNSGSKEETLTVSNNLHDVVGLAPKSIERLNKANVFTVDELRKLSYVERRTILGPIVASKLKSL